MASDEAATKAGSNTASPSPAAAVAASASPASASVPAPASSPPSSSHAPLQSKFTTPSASMTAAAAKMPATSSSSSSQRTTGTAASPTPPPPSSGAASSAPAAASTSSSTSRSEADDIFARAQAMGLRLTRQEFERTRAGVAAFLKADRVQSPLPTTPVTPNAPLPSQPSSSAAHANPTSSASASGRSASQGPAASGQSQVTSATEAGSPTMPAPAAGPSSSRSQQSRALSFFTAVLPPQDAKAGSSTSFEHPPNPRPTLDDVGSAEEKKRRRLRRRRLREKLASMSMSEPEGTPATFFGSPSAPSSSRNLAAMDATPTPAAVVGLGLGLGPEAGSSSSLPTPGAQSQPSPLSPRIRGRTVSASALSSSAELQAATAMEADRAALYSLTSPGLRRLSSRAWMSPSGKLSLVDPSSAFPGAEPNENLMGSPLTRSRSEPGHADYEQAYDADVSMGVQHEDDGQEGAFDDSIDFGFQGADQAGWGVRPRDVFAASNMSSGPLMISRGMAQLGLLDRVMQEKGSPRRHRADAKARRRAAGGRRDGNDDGGADAVDNDEEALAVAAQRLTPKEREVLEVAAANGASSSRQGASSSGSHAQHRKGRSISHARHLSKTVRWAPAIASPVHERMTTREHYEYSVHGIHPEQTHFSDIDVMQVQAHSLDAPAHTTMPWLFSDMSGRGREDGHDDFDDDDGDAQAGHRMFGSPIGKSSSRLSDSLTVGLSPSPNIRTGAKSQPDYDLDYSGQVLLNPRRGLLFGGPASPVSSTPARTTVNRFNPGFSDPSLSQSPQRGFGIGASPPRLPSSMTTRRPRGTPGRDSIGSARDLFGGSGAIIRPSPSRARNAAFGGSPVALRSGKTDTISPAAIFGSMGPPASGSNRGSRTLSSSGAPHTQPPPEPTKHWGQAGWETAPPRTNVPAEDEQGRRIPHGVHSEEESPTVSRGLRPAMAPAPNQHQRQRSISAGGPGQARVRPGGIMDWGTEGLEEGPSDEQMHPDSSPETQFSHKSRRALPTHSTQAAGSSLSAALGLDRPATSKASNSHAAKKHDASKAASSKAGSSDKGPPTSAVSRFVSCDLLPPGADPNGLEWDREDGSRVVKLVSEELQAALESGEIEEPPPRFYVLPKGFGSTKDKPSNASYAGLIGQAILTSSDKRLSLAEIYNWISTVHPFFERGDRGWQNSIRHNLSLNKSFIKVEREANMPGKGGWWAIKEGHEDRFMNGLYSAAPEKLQQQQSSKKKSKQQQQQQASASKGNDATEKRPEAPTPTPKGEATEELLPPLMPSQPSEQGARPLLASRKRTTTAETDSPASSPLRHSPGRSKHGHGGAYRKAGKSGKTLKKVKVGDRQQQQQQQQQQSRPPLNEATGGNVNLQYASLFNSTPSRSADQAYMNPSSSHGGSQSGMPMLTDSASSPPSSPPLFDALMPPPSLGPSSAKKAHGRKGAGRGVHTAADGVFLLSGNGGGNGGFPGTPGFYGSGAGGNMGLGGFYATQPSPLAGRLRGLGTNIAGAGPGGSPLRRSTLGAGSSATGSPSKIGTVSPVSSLRGSSLAGAMNMSLGGGGSASKTRGGGNSNENASSSGAGSTLFAAHPFASAGRSSPASIRSGSFAHAASSMGYSPMRGSPLRASGANSSNPSLVLSPAGASMQMALSGGGSGMGPSLGGLGSQPAFGMNLTPSRGTPTSAFKSSGGGGLSMAMGGFGVSPSPTIRRFQAQQNASGWLDDPFDYQGALQHELEAMGGLEAGGSGGGSGSGNGSGSGSGSSSLMPATSGLMNVSPLRMSSHAGMGMGMGSSALYSGMGMGMGMGMSAGFGGGNWMHALQQDNVSAVREGGGGGSAARSGSGEREGADDGE